MGRETLIGIYRDIASCAPELLPIVVSVLTSQLADLNHPPQARPDTQPPLYRDYAWEAAHTHLSLVTLLADLSPTDPAVQKYQTYFLLTPQEFLLEYG